MADSNEFLIFVLNAANAADDRSAPVFHTNQRSDQASAREQQETISAGQPITSRLEETRRFIAAHRKDGHDSREYHSLGYTSVTETKCLRPDCPSPFGRTFERSTILRLDVQNIITDSLHRDELARNDGSPTNFVSISHIQVYLIRRHCFFHTLQLCDGFIQAT